MNRVLSRATILAFALVCSSRGSEGAGEMLKVPPVGDRPLGRTNQPSVTKDAAPAPESPEVADPADHEKTDAAGETAAEAIVPDPFPVSRYASLWENSPFQIESIAPPQQSEALAQRFVLGGILREKGEYRVWVRERATQKSHQVIKNSPNDAGLSLVEVTESLGKQRDASATIRLGAEVGVIKFDSAGAPGAVVPAIPPTVVPRQPPALQSAGIPAPPQAGLPLQQAGANPSAAMMPGVVPPAPAPNAPGIQGTQAVPGQNQMPPPRVIRRRAIVPAAP